MEYLVRINKDNIQYEICTERNVGDYVSYIKDGNEVKGRITKREHKKNANGSIETLIMYAEIQY